MMNQVFLLLVAVSCAVAQRDYLPPSATSGTFGHVERQSDGLSRHAQAINDLMVDDEVEGERFKEQRDSLDNLQYQSPEARAVILRFNNENYGDGNYNFVYETENGINHEETGELRQVLSEEGENVEVTVVRGSYSYTGSDGRTYTVNYEADENGFRATGDHITNSGNQIQNTVNNHHDDHLTGVAVENNDFQNANNQLTYENNDYDQNRHSQDDQENKFDSYGNRINPQQGSYEYPQPPENQEEDAIRHHPDVQIDDAEDEDPESVAIEAQFKTALPQVPSRQLFDSKSGYEY